MKKKPQVTQSCKDWEEGDRELRLEIQELWLQVLKITGIMDKFADKLGFPELKDKEL